MSMPFKLADSEKPPTTLPVAGQIQPRLSSSISGTRPESGRGAGGATVALVAGAGGAGVGAGIARASGTAGGRRCSCATTCSEYGSLTALGSVLKVGVLGRPLAGGRIG